MDRFFFRRQESDTQQPPRVFAIMQIFHGILNWLPALVRFTEEELKDAGICIGDQRYNR